MRISPSQRVRKHVIGAICATGLIAAMSCAAAPAFADGSDGTGSLGSSAGSSTGSGFIPVPVPTSAGMGALAAATTQIGKPYLWGGNGPNSWDCSGLMQWAYSTVGIHLPRTSQQMAQVGTEVPLWALAPGDLIIFYGNASHVGIYAGFGQVLNAYGPNGFPIGFNALDTMPPINTIRRLG